MTFSEASDFWDEHDFFEFPDIKEEKGVKFQLAKKKYVGLDEDLFKKISSKAKKLHTTPHHLINHWLKQKAASG